MNRPTEHQREVIVTALHRAIDTICDAWPVAVEASQSYGYPSHSSGFGERGLVRRSSDDVRRVRFDEYGDIIEDVRVPRTGEVDDEHYIPPPYSDPTGQAAERGDKADQWLSRTRRQIGLLIRLSPADAPGENRWSGRDDVPELRRTAKEAVIDVVELWPLNCDRLFERIHRAANTAATEWPHQPKEGDVVQVDYAASPVKVGGRYIEMAECAECKHPITSQVDNFGGKPYHRKPCGKVVRERARRKARRR